eukprot:CAMPEP_0117545656 /NCGR_PEP_ID=MMETSP0784-20121206/46209_1 /TAXON_ID=39447 /ORGANISM="" /LENGTH=637 /DNA_ID=CAMNT_0005342513 /DNA_START=67 /DNA_END=1978 /DNA_ORIENTATION=+
MMRPDRTDLDHVLASVADTGKGLSGEFLASPLDRHHSPALIALAVWHGFLPMGASDDRGYLLLKLHRQRCVLEPKEVHVGRKQRKSASRFRLSVDEAFAEVVRETQARTFTRDPGDNWLAVDLAEMYAAVQRLPDVARKGVTFHSIELWHRTSGRLVAGEIGYTVGSIYSSCTGFALKEEYPGAGTLQLAALGRWLHECGFRVWDLGMSLPYKLELGAQPQPRRAWVACVRQLRGLRTTLVSPSAMTSARDVLGSGAILSDGHACDASKRRIQVRSRVESKRRRDANVQAVRDDAAHRAQYEAKAIQVAFGQSKVGPRVREANWLRHFWLMPLFEDMLRAIVQIVQGQWPRTVAEVGALLLQSSRAGHAFGSCGPCLLHCTAVCLEGLFAGGHIPYEIADGPSGVSIIIAAAELAAGAELAVAHEAAQRYTAGDTFRIKLDISFVVAKDALQHDERAEVSAAIGQDSLIWSVVAHRLVADSSIGGVLPLDVACERLGLLAASRGLDALAATRLVEVHMLEHFGAYVEWELALEASCCPTKPQAGIHFEGLTAIYAAVHRVVASALPRLEAAASAAVVDDICAEFETLVGAGEAAGDFTAAADVVFGRICRARCSQFRSHFPKCCASLRPVRTRAAES